MVTRTDIDAMYEPLHAKLTKKYYIDKTVDKATFDKFHTAIWLFHERDSIQAGILPNFVADEQIGKLRLTQIGEMIEELGGETKLRSLINVMLG